MNIIIFFKEPIPGEVKTRLGKEIGHYKATKIYEKLLYYNFDLIFFLKKKSSTLILPPLFDQKSKLTIKKALSNEQMNSNFLKTADKKNFLYKIFPYIAEEPSSEFRRAFEKKYSKIKVQTSGDLGRRMNDAIKEVYQIRSNPTLIIGSDSLDLNENVIIEAATALTKVEVVLGPTNDGGYYLIGLKQPNSLVFLNRTWSHNQVLKEQVSVCNRLGLSFQLLSKGNDLDTYRDLKTLSFQNPLLFKKIDVTTHPTSA